MTQFNLQTLWKFRIMTKHNVDIAKAINEQLAKLKAKQRDLNLFLSDTYRVNPSYTNATTPVGAVMNGSKTASNSFETVVADLTAKKASIPTNRQQFYIDSVLSQAQFLSAAHATLYNVTTAHFILSSDPAGARCHLQSALTSSQTMQSALRQSAHHDFSTWYQGESLFGLTDMQNSINATIPLYPSSSCTTSSTTPPPATPTPTPISLIQAAYPSTPTSASTVKDGKRTVIQAKTTSTLKQIACFGCGTGSTIRVNNSTSSFTIGTQIFSGTTSSVSSSWGHSFRQYSAYCGVILCSSICSDNNTCILWHYSTVLY